MSKLIENLEAMLAAGQDNALLRYSLGNAYLESDPQSAAKHLKQAVKHDANYSAAWKALGRALVESNANHEAIAAYEQGIVVAEANGDIQAAKEMRVFLKRVKKSITKPHG